MIKLHELNPANRCLLESLSDAEAQGVLDMATDVMMAMEMKKLENGVGRPRLGENGAVELVVKMILFVGERGTE